MSAFRPSLAPTGGRRHLRVRPGTRPGLTFVVVGALALVSGKGGAQEPTDTPRDSATVVALEFIGPPGCGSESQFKASVATRSERIQFGSSADDQRRVRVELSRRAGNVVLATLTLIQRSGRRSARKIEASSCDEAVDAIALVTAVTLDPLGVSLSATPSHKNVGGSGGTSGASSGGGRGGGSAAPSGGSSPVGGASSSDTSSAGAAGAVPTYETIPGPLPGEEGPPWFGPGEVTWIAGAAVVGTWGAAPEMMPGAALFASVSNERRSVLSPSLRLRLSHSEAGGFEEAGGTASFRVDVATLELCPLRLGTTEVNLRPCGFASGGILGASGSDTTEPQEHNRPWGAAGGSLILAIRPVEQLQIECFGSLGSPFVRDAFQFAPTVFHSVWSTIPSVGVGTGFIFR